MWCNFGFSILMDKQQWIDGVLTETDTDYRIAGVTFLDKGEEVNLIYEFPWFWKCRANHDIRELKFNKLENQTKQQKKKDFG